VHICGDDLQLNIIAGIQCPGYPAEQPPIGARACRYAYFPLHIVNPAYLTAKIM
jgi:hypothetical protein